MQLPLTKTGYDTNIMEWEKKKRQEDKIVMQTRLPGETDASNILGSEGILLKKKKEQSHTDRIYFMCALDGTWDHSGYTVH